VAKRATAKRTAAKRKVATRKIAKHKRPAAKQAEPKPALLAEMFEALLIAENEVAATGDFSLHDLFQQQTMAMLDRSDLDEEQKQSILVAMNCPCCGGSGLSFTIKLKQKK
jgi:hypothetical protein